MAERTVATSPEAGGALAGQEGTRAQEQFIRPPVDIYETSEGLTVVADLPGVRKEDLEVEVREDVLTIRGRPSNSLPGHPHYREFELFPYFRQFQLSEKVDSSRITAELKHGVLTLHLPKAEAAKPKKIEVKYG